jgi:hypothetical protein
MGSWKSEYGSPPDWLCRSLDGIEAQVRGLGKTISQSELLQIQEAIEDNAEDSGVCILWFTNPGKGMVARLSGNCYGVYSMPRAVPPKMEPVTGMKNKP